VRGCVGPRDSPNVAGKRRALGICWESIHGPSRTLPSHDTGYITPARSFGNSDVKFHVVVNREALVALVMLGVKFGYSAGIDVDVCQIYGILFLELRAADITVT